MAGGALCGTSHVAVPYLLIGYDVLGEAAEGIMEGDPFDEDFLMSLATVGALLIGFLPGAEPQFIEGVFVMLFFQLGELFEDYAEDKARDSISELMDIRPDVAFVSRNGKTEGVSPEEVHTGETVIVKPGEKIPLDGTLARTRFWRSRTSRSPSPSSTVRSTSSMASPSPCVRVRPWAWWGSPAAVSPSARWPSWGCCPPRPGSPVRSSSRDATSLR